MKKKIILILLMAGIVLGTILLSGCITKECSACDGTGKCSYCGGTGWALNGVLECMHCGGSGHCAVCGGDGQISSIPGFEGIYLLFAISITVGTLFFIKKRKHQ